MKFVFMYFIKIKKILLKKSYLRECNYFKFIKLLNFYFWRIKMLLNWCEEIRNIDPSINFRSTGGWLKTVTGLDKSVLNGFSLIGEFVKSGDYKSEFADGLYLDCNKEGKKSNPKQDFRLLRLKNGKLTLIDQVYDAKKNWAVELWDSISEEIDSNYKESEVDKIMTLILDKTGKDVKLLKKLQSELNQVIVDFE